MKKILIKIINIYIAVRININSRVKGSNFVNLIMGYMVGAFVISAIIIAHALISNLLMVLGVPLFVAGVFLFAEEPLYKALLNYTGSMATESKDLDKEIERE